MSANYDDLSLFSNFNNQVKEDFEASQENNKDGVITYPIISGKSITWKMRFYPLIKEDENGNPKLILTRNVWSHSGFDKTRRLPCLGKDCPICAEARKLKDIKHSEAWKYTAKREAVAPVYIYETTAPKDYKWMKLNEHSYMQLRSKAIDSLNAFLTNLSPEEMQQVLNPRVDAPRIMFTVSGGSEGSASWGFDIKKAEIPEMPDDFPDIDTVYVDETKPATDEEMQTVRKTINKLLAESAGTLIEPDETPTVNTTKAEAKVAAKSAVSEALAKTSVVTETPAVNQACPDCPGKAEGLNFGDHPVTLGKDISVSCLACGDESSCVDFTKQKHNLA